MVEIWYGWRNGQHVRTYSSRAEAERELDKRLVDAISPKEQG